MNNAQFKDIFSSPYDFGDVRIKAHQNKVVRKVVSTNNQEPFSIQQKILRQTKPINTSNIEQLSSSLRSGAISGLVSRYKQQFRKTLQDNIDFAQELNSIKQFYTFYEINFVSGFLRRNRFLVPLLREIPEKIYHYFGKDQKLALKVSFEPDSPQLSELWILVLTELTAKEAFPILEKFDEEWWLENLDRTDCKLNISLEYI